MSGTPTQLSPDDRKCAVEQCPGRAYPGSEFCQFHEAVNPYDDGHRDCFEWDGEGLEGDDELGEDCHGYFESQSKSAVFVCGAVGSEDCDECPMYNWLGLTSTQIDELELSDE